MSNEEQFLKGNKPGAGGRGRKKIIDKRITRCFVASDTEWNAIKEAANNAGVSISQYIREMTIVWRVK